MCLLLSGASLDTVPVDYVAEAIRLSSRTRATIGHILHTCSGPGLAVDLGTLRRQVRERFLRRGLRLPPPIDLPVPLFRLALNGAMALMSARAQRAAKTIPIFLDYMAERQGFANDQMVAWLQSAGLPLPRPGEYLGRVIDAYLAAQSSP